MDIDLSQLRPLALVRQLEAGSLAMDDAIAWAERQLANDRSPYSQEVLLELAWLIKSDRNGDKIIALLERLVIDTEDFAISAAELEQARLSAESIKHQGTPDSIHADNCLMFVLGCCPSIAPAVVELRREYLGRVPGLFIEARPFTDWVVSMIAPTEPERIAAMQCLESLFVLGTPEVQGFAAVGILEGVISRCRLQDIDLTALATSLLPVSRREYDQMIRNW